MRPPELNRRDRLTGMLVVLAWLALAIILRDWNRPRDPEAPSDVRAVATPSEPVPNRSP